MRSRRSRLIATSFAFLVTSCGGSVNNSFDDPNDASTTSDGNVIGDETGVIGSDTSNPSDSTVAGSVPCAVEEILHRACGNCHGATPAFGAPTSLVTMADLQRQSLTNPSVKMWEEVKRRINLPADTVGRMPQKPNPPLAAADLAALNGWFDSGLPPRSGDCVTESDAGTPDTPPVTVSCTPDTQVRATSRWAMPANLNDEYVCYGFDLIAPTKKHITAVIPKIDNTRIVHHILLMQADSTVSSTPYACSEGAVARYRLLYGWAPGVGAFEFPPEAGLPAEPGNAHFVVQIHYNNVAGLSGETDGSGFDLCSTTELRPNDADMLAFGTNRFTIPARGSLDITASWTIPSYVGNIRAIGTFPHMHSLGKFIGTTLVRTDGTTADLGTDASFDFNNQYFSALPGIAIKPGDRVRTRCRWENPTSSEVKFGENTGDEMCFGFTLYYPKVTSGLWYSWMQPSILSTSTTN
jgi:hypothetical protein